MSKLDDFYFNIENDGDKKDQLIDAVIDHSSSLIALMKNDVPNNAMEMTNERLVTLANDAIALIKRVDKLLLDKYIQQDSIPPIDFLKIDKEELFKSEKCIYLHSTVSVDSKNFINKGE